MLNQKNSDQNENNKNTNLELFQINVDNNNTDVELDPMKLKIDENRDNVAEKKQTLGKFFYCYWLREWEQAALTSSIRNFSSKLKAGGEPRYLNKID